MTQLSLKLSYQTLPTTKHPIILKITLDPKLNFFQHINVTMTKAKQTLTFSKHSLLPNSVSKKEPIVSTFKAITRPILEYANPYEALKHQQHH